MTQTLAAIVIVALASYRLAGVIALDTISEPFRAWVYGRGHNELPVFHMEPTPGIAGTGEVTAADLDMADLIRSGTITPRDFEIEGVIERKEGATAWRWLYGLISCPFCCGWWLSIIGWWAYTGEFLSSRQWLVQAIAVAGVQSAIPNNRGNS